MRKIWLGARKRKGFTLTELIIVVSILGILATLITPLVGEMINDSKESADLANAALLENAITRAIAREDMTLTSNTAAIVAAIADEVPAIPVAQQGAAYAFYLNQTTGAVTCNAADPGAGYGKIGG